MAYSFCPPSIYRPPIVAYQARPYNLHHYQYTQYNMIPYSTPSATIPPQHTVTVPSNLHAANSSVDMVFGPPPRDRRNLERGSEEEKAANPPQEAEFVNGAPGGDVLAPPSTSKETPSSEPSNLETFVKFLEESCLRAEQIAYRNRNRPCFRNIQNLCMRTRGEILKPCTTISNIHSQGIPWATKDFIYAFVRLVNCWHILKGYLDNEGGLGKIEKELSEDFKACYYRWEKDSMELAEELRRIFCSLDANLSGSSYHNQDASTQREQGSPKRSDLKTAKNTSNDHLANAESSLSSSKEGDSDNDSKVYMKPGSYNVPRKNDSSNNSPRSFEFLETAQNTHRRLKDKQETADKIWQNAQSAAPGLISKINPSTSLDKAFEDMLPGGTEVETWINTGLYPVMNDSLCKTSSKVNSKPITVLQRKCSTLEEAAPAYQGDIFKDSLQRTSNKRIETNGSSSTLSKGSNNKFEFTSRTYRKRNDTHEPKMARRTFSTDRRHGNDGISKEAINKLKEIIAELKTTEFFMYLADETCKVSLE